MVCNFIHASGEVLAMEMEGVMVVVGDAIIVLRINLSCSIQ